MAPRRNGRRCGMTRMDAAMDAMIPLGFPTQIVRDKMNDLLKEYGGEEGYPFIEADAYKVLIDALLSGEEEESKQGVTSTKGSASGDERVGNHTVVTTATAGLSSGSNDTPNMLLPTARAEGDNNKFADHSDGSVGNMHIYCPTVFSLPSSIASTPATQSAPTRRRRPCYGWISDGEEENNDFVYLTPADLSPASLSPTVQMEGVSNETVRSSKRRSRWDLGPEDM